MQTPLGKGLVRESLNGGRVLVELGARTVIFRLTELSILQEQVSPQRSSTRGGQRTSADAPGAQVAREIDLHGLTVQEALARVDEALNDALLDGSAELRLIHGRSGGRIRSAVHQRLREIGAVDRFCLDPRNPGVTVVRF